MSRFLLLVFIFLVGRTAIWADIPESQVRASIKADPQSWVGQKIILNIELLAPGYFASTPRFDFPQVSGVLILPPEGHPVLSTEQIAGQSYTVQNYDVAFFAQRGGVHEIPSFKIRFDIKRDPLDQQEVPQEVLTPRLSFEVKIPPGAEGLHSLLSSHNLTVDEKWQPISSSGKVGDAFTRTITFEASDVPGMAFPPFSAAKIPGLGVYPQTPVVSDQIEQGELRGRRVDTFVYVCQQSGRFVILAGHLTWWNVDEQTLHTIDFPEHVLEISPNPALAEGEVRESTEMSWDTDFRNMVFLVFGGIVGGVAWFLMPKYICSQILTSLRPTHLVPLNPSSGDQR